MWIYANPNPLGRTEPDCVIRAICLATGKDWYKVYDDLCRVGRSECSMPSVNHVWGLYLYDRGFEPFLLPKRCPDCVTVREFCDMYPEGTYIVGTGSHAVCIRNGDYLDSWDSGNETLSFYFRKKDEL